MSAELELGAELRELAAAAGELVTCSIAARQHLTQCEQSYRAAGELAKAATVARHLEALDCSAASVSELLS